MLQRINIALLIGLAMVAEAAHAGPQLPNGGSGVFAFFASLLQDLVDFMSGPFGTAAVIVSTIVGFVTWVFAPKEGVMGVVLRVVVAAIVILNIGTWIVALRT